MSKMKMLDEFIVMLEKFYDEGWNAGFMQGLEEGAKNKMNEIREMM